MAKLTPIELAAAKPCPLNRAGFNPQAQLPYGLEIGHVRAGMLDFLEFLWAINSALTKKRLKRLESFLMPANFSSMVGEFMAASIPNYCRAIIKNNYHNGHPDLIPAGQFPGDACLHGKEGIEIKASRHKTGWQGHNAEDVWLMVFVFESSSPRDHALQRAPVPFRFLQVVGARISKQDWRFSGRSATSRRTITASVLRTGFAKMQANWIYRAEPQAVSRPQKGPAGPAA
jgi:hypothetical protein